MEDEMTLNFFHPQLPLGKWLRKVDSIPKRRKDHASNWQRGCGTLNAKENSIGVRLFKYLEHGIFFSIIMSGYLLFLPPIQWMVAYDQVPLTFEPLPILFLIIYIFVGIFILIGGINSYINKRLWGIDTSHAWQDLLGDGTVLFILLCLFQLPAALVTTLLAWMQPSGIFLSFSDALLPIFVPSILITSVPNGIACRYMATMRSKELKVSE